MIWNKYDLGWPWPAMAWSGVWVPSQRLGVGDGSESSKSQPLDRWSVTNGPGPSALWKNIPTKTESSAASKVIRGKRVRYLWIGTRADSDRESLSHFLVAL